MPCETINVRGDPIRRRKEIEEALKRLNIALGTGAVTLKVGPQGAVAIIGWNDRRDITDVCAIRRMTVESSWEFRKALAKAESLAGRKVDMKQVVAGVHSHDGKTWGVG